jgi:DNA-binding NarL/FixJ family response regulator
MMRLHHEGSEDESKNERMAIVSSAAAPDLTHRERQVLDCLSRGLATPAIAEELGIARATVRNHVQNVLRKLGVHTKLAAVVQALRSPVI